MPWTPNCTDPAQSEKGNHIGRLSDQSRRRPEVEVAGRDHELGPLIEDFAAARSRLLDLRMVVDHHHVELLSEHSARRIDVLDRKPCAVERRDVERCHEAADALDGPDGDRVIGRRGVLSSSGNGHRQAECRENWQRRTLHAGAAVVFPCCHGLPCLLVLVPAATRRNGKPIPMPDR